MNPTTASRDLNTREVAQFNARSIRPSTRIDCSPFGGTESRVKHMNEFRLFAHGEAFDLDAFLASSTLAPDYVWRRGAQRRYACVESCHPTSGVEFVLGDGLTVPFRKQEGIAVAYLKSHRDELRALARFPGVDTFILGLQYRTAFENNVTGFCLGPSTQLMRHCLDVGCKPTYYVTLDRLPEPEPEVEDEDEDDDDDDEQNAAADGGGM